MKSSHDIAFEWYRKRFESNTEIHAILDQCEYGHADGDLPQVSSLSKKRRDWFGVVAVTMGPTIFCSTFFYLAGHRDQTAISLLTCWLILFFAFGWILAGPFPSRRNVLMRQRLDAALSRIAACDLDDKEHLKAVRIIELHEWRRVEFTQAVERFAIYTFGAALVLGIFLHYLQRYW